MCLYCASFIVHNCACCVMLSQMHYDASNTYFFVHCFNCSHVEESVLFYLRECQECRLYCCSGCILYFFSRMQKKKYVMDTKISQ